MYGQILALHGSGYSLILALAGHSIQGIKTMTHANFCITKTTVRLYFFNSRNQTV